MGLLEFTDRGIYCPEADIFIDPWKPVKKALITHGHADHARPGSGSYLCTHSAKPVIRFRLGPVYIDSVGYGETVNINGVKFSFWPAGHVVGSAQIQVEHKGEVWVVSGDYKTEFDGLSEAFEPRRCHHFITESTFGLPVYNWAPQSRIFEDINGWWAKNKAEGKVTLLTGYALGKAQRIIHNLDDSIGTIFTHGAVENINEILRRQGVPLKPTRRIQTGMAAKDFAEGIIIAPPSAATGPWLKKFKQLSVGVASGWMAIRGARRRRAVERGFVLSDHADWAGLNNAIEATGASTVYVTHGYTAVFSSWLREKGLQAFELKTEYQGELNEINESDTTED